MNFFFKYIFHFQAKNPFIFLVTFILAPNSLTIALADKLSSGVPGLKKYPTPVYDFFNFLTCLVKSSHPLSISIISADPDLMKCYLTVKYNGF